MGLSFVSLLSVDEKSQIQALDGTQLGLPLKKGRARTVTDGYERRGTTAPFAAMNVLDGAVDRRQCSGIVIRSSSDSSMEAYPVDSGSSTSCVCVASAVRSDFLGFSRPMRSQ